MNISIQKLIPLFIALTIRMIVSSPVFAQTADGPVLADTVVTYGTRGEKIVEYIMLPAPLVRDDRKAPDERFLGNGDSVEDALRAGGDAAFTGAFLGGLIGGVSEGWHYWSY